MRIVPGGAVTKTLLLLLAIVLAGCAAAPTGYIKKDAAVSPNYGYQEQRMGGSDYSISFTGNRNTSPERAAEIALLRAAELTREEGATFFLILKQKTAAMPGTKIVPITVVTHRTAALVPVQEGVNLEPTALLLIHVVGIQESPPPEVIDARVVVDRMWRQFR